MREVSAEEYGAPAKSKGLCGGRKKEPSDMELSPKGGSGMEMVSSDAGASASSRPREDKRYAVCSDEKTGVTTLRMTRDESAGE